MSEELKTINCGCGGEAVLEIDHDTIQPGAPIDWKRVRCNNCNIRTTWRKSEAEAIKVWNTAMSGVVYPCTTPNGVYTSGCTITNTTDDKDDFHPVYDCMVGKERTAKVTLLTPNSKGYWSTNGRCQGCGFLLERKHAYCPNCGARLEWNYDK